MKGFIRNKKFIVLLVILGVFGISSVAFALEVSWPPSPFGTSLTDDTQLPTFIGYLYEWGISIGGLLVFITLVIAGFQYVASAGSPTLMGEAKSRMISAGIGLVLLLGSWLILNTINPQFIQLSLPPLEPGEIPEDIEVPEITAEELIEQLDPCERVTVRRVMEGGVEGEEVTLTPESGCVLYFNDTDEHVDLETPGDEKCMGFVEFCSGTECETAVAIYALSGGTTRNKLVDEVVQSVQLVVPAMPETPVISVWDVIKKIFWPF